MTIQGRQPRLTRYILGSVVPVTLLVLMGTAQGAGNDLVLRRLGECTFQTIDGREQCVAVAPDLDGFESLSRDLGFVMSPKGISPAETVGEAGFEMAFEISMNVIEASAEYWKRAVEDQQPDNVLVVSQIHLVKGLPFSFELGAILSHLFQSDMWALGAELSWAWHEDYFWPVPDLGVRGFVNHTVGSTDINLTTAGFDALVSIPVGVGGVISLTPFVGYNFTVVFTSSRLLDATPDDISPPIEGAGNQPSIKPEFVFDNTSNMYSRFLAGFRIRFAVVNFSFETLWAEEVQAYSLKLGLDF